MGYYRVDGFSPYASEGVDPDEEARRRREEAAAEAEAAARAPAATPPIPYVADTPVDSGVAVAPAQPRTWSADVRAANDAQMTSAQRQQDALTAYQQRAQAIQQRKDALVQQRSQAAQPIQAFGNDGKLAQQYRPSVAQRIFRGLSAVQRGGVFAAIDPTAVGVPGYTSPNNRYYRDAAAQGQRVAALDAGIKSADADSKDAFEIMKGLSAEERQAASTLNDVAQRSTAQQDAETKTAQIPIDRQKAYNESPEGYGQRKMLIDQATLDQRTRTADSLNMKGQTRMLFLANGRIPDPRQATSEEIARNQALRAWQRDNPGKQPTLADINGINQAAAGRVAGGGTGVPGAPLDAAWEAQAQQIAHGLAKKLPLNSRSSPTNVAIMHRANEINPQLSDTLYDTVKDFREKGGQQAVQQLGTALAHLTDARKFSAQAGFSPLINHPNFETSGSGATSVSYQKAIQLATDEIGKLVKTGVVTEAESKRYLENLDSPRQGVRDAALTELTNLMSSRFRTRAQQYKVGTNGMPLPVNEFFDQNTQQLLRDNHVFDGEEAVSGYNQPNTAPQSMNSDDWFNKVNQ